MSVLVELRCTVCCQCTTVTVNEDGNPWHPAINFVHQPCQAAMVRVHRPHIIPPETGSEVHQYDGGES